MTVKRIRTTEINSSKEILMKTKTIIAICAIAISAALSGCSTTPISMAASNTPLQGIQVKENLGKTEGTNSAVSVLGLFMIGHPDLEIALKAAIKAKEGDALINIRCYESYKYFLIFSLTTVIVEGEAVKFADIAETPAPKGKTR